MAHRGVFLDLCTLDPQTVDLTPLKSVIANWDFHDNLTDPDAVIAAAQGKTVIVTNKVQLTGEMLAALPELQLICIAATGMNNVDLEAAEKYGKKVCNVAGYSTMSVAQHTFAFILSFATRLPAYTQDVRAGRWAASPAFTFLDYPIHDLEDQILGVVGYGAIGQAVARLGEAFGMKVMVAARRGCEPASGRYSFEEVVATADYLSLHCPLTVETQHLIDASTLAAMKASAYLINMARGPVVDEVALLKALQLGEIAGAGLDVLSAEPPPADHVLLSANLPNLWITPHTAWASRGARARLVAGIAQNISAHIEGSR